MIMDQKKRLLGRQDIWGASDIVTEEVEVPEWGGSVLVRGLTGKERDQFEASIIVGRGKKRDINMRQMRAKLAAHSMVDEQGNLLFSASDVEALSNKSSAALERVFAAAQKLSGLSDADMEELAKNSGSDQSGDSGST